MNVDRFDAAAYHQMVALLGAGDAVCSGPRFTFDHARNEMAKPGAQNSVDYVLYSLNHLPAVRCSNEVLVLRGNGRDLSDHFAVAGRFVFGFPDMVVLAPATESGGANSGGGARMATSHP